MLQGEREFARDNRTLGHFQLDGIAPAPRGLPQIEVIFDIDANGILNVTAKDKGTGKTQKIRIESSSGLSKDEVERMRREAEAHAAEDKAKRELVDLQNRAEQEIHEIEKSLAEHRAKLPEADVKAIETGRDALREALKGEDKAKIESALESFRTAAQRLGQIIYQQQQASTPPPSGAQGEAPGGKGSDEPVDADFEVKT